MTALEILTLYEHARDTRGMTVEEWEQANGFPRHTVYPRARRRFMYTTMAAEEDRKRERRAS
jgi:hypothetical protein